MESRTWGALVGDITEYLKNPATAIPTGLPSVDTLLRGGLKHGHVALLFGRTGVGKSLLATQVAVNMATQGRLVAYASLEMTREEVGVRAIASHLSLPVDQAEQALLDGDARVAELRLMSVDDTPKPDFLELGHWCNEVAELAGQNVDCVVIDHLKLMRRYAKHGGEAERVARLAEDAKAFAKQQNVAVILIHQVGRTEGDKKNHGHMPLTLESGMYGGEADADVVLGMYRPALDPSLDPKQRRLLERSVYVQVLKNRHGDFSLDGIPLTWRRPTLRLEEAGAQTVEEADYLGEPA